jgi:hypothetical protein
MGSQLQELKRLVLEMKYHTGKGLGLMPQRLLNRGQTSPAAPDPAFLPFSICSEPIAPKY